jgi:hypothetical protein
MDFVLYYEIRKAINSDTPQESLTKTVEIAKSHNDREGSIVSFLHELLRGQQDQKKREIIIDVMGEISPHIRRTRTLETPEIQAQFRAALNGKSGSLLALLRTMKDQVDKGGLIVELHYFLLWVREHDPSNEDEVLDSMDCVVEWGCTL